MSASEKTLVFSYKEYQLLRYVLQHAHRHRVISQAVYDPAWAGLLQKCELDHPSFPKPDRMPSDPPEGEEALRRHFENQGYTDKEIAVILHRMKE